MSGMLKMVRALLRSLVGGPPMMRCEEALARLFEYLDGELDESEAGRIEEHLEFCKKCYPRAQFERSFLEAVRRASGEEKVSEELHQRVLAVLEGDPTG